LKWTKRTELGICEREENFNWWMKEKRTKHSRVRREQLKRLGATNQAVAWNKKLWWSQRNKREKESNILMRIQRSQPE
jgi:hypothetical protein